jgi:hypothetical protein
MITVFEAMKDAVERFVAAEIEDPWANAAFLAQHLLQTEDLVDKAEVHSRMQTGSVSPGG